MVYQDPQFDRNRAKYRPKGPTTILSGLGRQTTKGRRGRPRGRLGFMESLFLQLLNGTDTFVVNFSRWLALLGDGPRLPEFILTPDTW